MAKISKGELWIDNVLAGMIAPPWTREHHFHPTRDFSMDFAWPDLLICIEYEGKGHSRWNRYHSDVDKYNLAELLGWTVFRITFKQLDDGTAISWMRLFVDYIKREHDQDDQDDP